MLGILFAVNSHQATPNTRKMKESTTLEASEIINTREAHARGCGQFANQSARKKEKCFREKEEKTKNEL